jgi:molybdenum ABC transporter molybdate-binding protein
MPDADPIYGRSRSLRLLLGGPLLALALLAIALALLTRDPAGDRGAVLSVHCAAGIKDPVVEIASLYRKQYGVEVRLNYGNSGSLLAGIELHPDGDLYIPADAVYVARGREKGLLAEALPVSEFRLVVAVKTGNPKGIRSLDDLLRDGIDYVVCNEEAGAGQKTKELLGKIGRWEEVKRRAKVFKPTVTDAASVVQTSADVDAGLVWDATARQYRLDFVELPELTAGAAVIHAAVLSASKQPAAALRFARFLAAPEKGAPVFRAHGYEPAAGDAWAEVPELVVYCGGANRVAVEATFRDFETREGCRILENFDGCGTLVGKLSSSPRSPELFLTCDASYLAMVQDLFLDPRDVSETRVVVLARDKGGKEIRRLEDLAGDGVRVGITRPGASTLGALSVKLLEGAGLWDAVRRNVRVEAPTAHELMLQLIGHDKLDAAMVYEANCRNLPSGFRVLPIDLPAARAVQNVAAGRNTKYPQMVSRLIDALTSARSRQRFESAGFSWRAGGSQP